MKIYVASSWRNIYQPEVVSALRADNHEVYDFRNPEPGNNGFHWSEVDGGYHSWDFEKYKKALEHPIAEKGYQLDYQAMNQSDCCVLVLPSGRSAHLEAGYFAFSESLFIYHPPGEPVTPELMYKMANFMTSSLTELREVLTAWSLVQKHTTPIMR